MVLTYRYRFCNISSYRRYIIAINDSFRTRCSNFKVSKLKLWKKYTVSIEYFLVLLNATTESVNCSLFLKNLEKHFCNLTYKKKTSPNTLKIYLYRKNLSAIIYRLPMSLQEIVIHRLSVSPKDFLKISIVVNALVQKGLSCPSLGIVA